MELNRLIVFYSELKAKYPNFSANPDIPIPQEVFRPARREPDFVADPPIEFQCFDATGIHLKFAENVGFREGGFGNTLFMLDGKSESTFSTTSAKIMLRIIWEGYHPFSREINIECSVGGVRQRISKAMLAHHVAMFMRRFYKDHQRAQNWNSSILTPEKVPFENLVLLKLEHVSKGSYQPVLVSRTFNENAPS